MTALSLRRSIAPIFAILFLVMSAVSRAATLEVTSLAASGAGSLSEAITTANASTGVADTIIFSVTGTISLGSELLPEISDDLSIEGPGETLLTIDGGGVASAGRVFRAVDCGSANFAFSGMTITNSPAGIFEGACDVDVVIENVTASDNIGANADLLVFQDGAVLTMTACTVADNSINLEGSVIFISDSDGSLITGSAFSDNYTEANASAVTFSHSGGRIESSSFLRNSAQYAAGAIQAI